MYSCHDFLISSASVRSLLFLSFILTISAWNVRLIAPVFLKKSVVFPNLFFPVFFFLFVLRLSYLSLLFSGTLHLIEYISPFPLCLLLPLFSQLFGRPPHMITLPSCISLLLGLVLVSTSCTMLQCYKTLSIVLHAFCLPCLIPWNYLSPPLYNHKGLDLGHIWTA